MDAAEKSKVNPAYDDPIVVGKSLKLQSNRNTEFLVPIEMIEATPEILARVRIFTFFRKKFFIGVFLSCRYAHKL